METTIVGEGLHFGEGPRWHDGQLWFSDFYDHAVKTFTPGGPIEIAFRLEGEHRPSGLGWLPDGRLLVVSMLDRRILRREADGKLNVHADLSAIATFHCNDMVVDGKGRAYVGNFGFDLDPYLEEHGVEAALGEPGPPKATLARVDPDGSAHAAAPDLKFPNGSVVTPDGSTLIVAETLGLRLTAFRVGDDGSLHDRRVWAPLTIAPDGICLDADGAIWVANPLAPEVIRVAEGGEVLDRVTTTQQCFACMLGGSDRRTLYCITAATSNAHEASAARTGRLEAVDVKVAGAGLP